MYLLQPLQLRQGCIPYLTLYVKGFWPLHGHMYGFWNLTLYMFLSLMPFSILMWDQGTHLGTFYCVIRT